MVGFLRFVEFLVAIGVVITLVSNYLIVNKLWSRRRIRDVSESISVSAALLGLFTSVPFFIEFVLVDQNPAAALKSFIAILTGFVFVAVGSGLFVQEYRGRGFWNNLKHALSLERSESTDLLRALVQPRGAQEIMVILQHLAAVDRRIDERELTLLREFAEAWNVQLPDLTAGEVTSGGDLVALRESVQSYLALQPPHEQAAHVMDVLQLLAGADSDVSEQEEIAMDETRGLLEQYLGDEAGSTFEVLIVPQSEAQIEAVREILPGLEQETRRGGQVFSVGHFFSHRYADVICQRYIDLGLFTARVERDADTAT